MIDSIITQNIPKEIQALPQWVARNAGKVPMNPRTGKNASPADRQTWGTLQEALDACSRYNLAGVGFVFSADDPYCGVDLDHCRDQKTGEIKGWARLIVDRLQGYAEISPSGTGVHIIIKAKLPDGAKHKKTLPDGGAVEFYDSGRYFTMTGRVLE